MIEVILIFFCYFYINFFPLSLIYFLVFLANIGVLYCHECRWIFVRYKGDWGFTPIHINSFYILPD